MKTYLITLSERQEKELMEAAGVKTRNDLAHMLKATRVILADYESWSCTVCDNADEPDNRVTWQDTARYVRFYLSMSKSCCNKSVLSRLASVLTRAATCRLKPSQVSGSGNDHSNTERVPSV